MKDQFVELSADKPISEAIFIPHGSKFIKLDCDLPTTGSLTVNFHGRSDSWYAAVPSKINIPKGRTELQIELTSNPMPEGVIKVFYSFG